MHRDGHLGAALLTFAPVGLAMVEAGAVVLAGLGATVVVTMATVPDYDQRVAFVSHRGVTHTLAFALAVGSALGAAAGWLGETGCIVLGESFPGSGYRGASLQAVGFFGGTFAVLSHLAADALTPSGVPLLWPLSDHRFSLGLVASDCLPANYGLLVAGVVASAAWGRSLLGA